MPSRFYRPLRLIGNTRFNPPLWIPLGSLELERLFKRALGTWLPAIPSKLIYWLLNSDEQIFEVKDAPNGQIQSVAHLHEFEAANPFGTSHPEALEKRGDSEGIAWALQTRRWRA